MEKAPSPAAYNRNHGIFCAWGFLANLSLVFEAWIAVESTSLQIFAAKPPSGQTPKASLFPAGANGAAGVVADRLMLNAVFAKQTGVICG